MLADWLPGDAVGATEAGDTGDEEAVVERRGGAVADGDAAGAPPAGERGGDNAAWAECAVAMCTAGGERSVARRAIGANPAQADRAGSRYRTPGGAEIGSHVAGGRLDGGGGAG